MTSGVSHNASAICHSSFSIVAYAEARSVSCPTHAGELSATGDEELDATLSIPERFEIPDETVTARWSNGSGDRFNFHPRVVPGILTGIHDPSRRHCRLLVFSR